MTVKTGQAWAGTFVTLDSTGALAAGSPAGALYVDGVANAATVTITGTNPYKWAVTLPALTAGQRVDMYITGTIATIATAGIVASEQADTSLLSDGVVVASLANDSITAASLKADAVYEIQSGLALESTLTDIMGVGWNNGTLQNIKNDTDSQQTTLSEIKAKTDNLPASPAAVGSAMTLTAAYDKAKDDVLTPLAVVDSIVDGLKTTLDNIHDTDLPAIKAETALIVEDTGTTIPALLETIDNFLDTEIADILADTNELQAELADGGRTDLLIDSIIAHLTDIKGAGWTNQTLAKIVTDIAAISAGSGATAQEVWEYATRVLTAGTNIDLSSLATATDLATLDGKADAILEDTGTTLDTLVKDIPTNAELATALGTADDAVLAALATTDGKVDSILEDTGTTLDTLIKDMPTNTELATALGTADDAVLAAVAAAKVVIDDIHNTDLPAVKAETALIVEDTGTTLPALLETIDNFLDTEVAAILEDTGTTLPATLATLAGYTDGIAGDVWSSPIRTLTVPSVAAAATEDGTTLTLHKDADIHIEVTGLTIPTGAKKVVFTIKDNLDDADTTAALQATYQLTAVPAETHTLNYINSAVPPVLTTPVTFTVDTDSVEFDMTAAAAYYLPRYERGYLHWDLKLITATTVQILQQGLVQILGTSTRAVA